MRKLTDMTGLNLGDGMEEALSRMERGEDPEAIESEMGDTLEGEDPFSFGKKSIKARKKRPLRMKPFMICKNKVQLSGCRGQKNQPRIPSCPLTTAP